MSATSTKGPRYRQTPLWRDSNRFLVEVETAVRAFPRYHNTHWVAICGATAVVPTAGPTVSPVFESIRGES